MRYLHDCSRCRSLGTFHEYDLYACEQFIGGFTVIARYGNEGCEYTSGLNTQHPALIEAEIRALEIMVA